jgi:methionyl-tRNA formyltransferase
MCFEISFIGAGDWGIVCFQHLMRNKNISVARIMTHEPFVDKFKSLANETALVIKKPYNSYVDFFDSGSTFLVAGWGERIPIEDFKNMRGFNVHASLLPKHRGPQPLVQSLLQNESTGGVTIHEISSTFDSGKIYNQKEFQITSQDNTKSLFFKASRCASICIKNWCNELVNNSANPKIQDEVDASYSKRINPLDYVIDESSHVHEVLRITRAFGSEIPIMLKYQNKIYFSIETNNVNNSSSIKLVDGTLLINKAFELENLPRQEQN